MYLHHNNADSHILKETTTRAQENSKNNNKDSDFVYWETWSTHTSVQKQN